MYVCRSWFCFRGVDLSSDGWISHWLNFFDTRGKVPLQKVNFRVKNFKCSKHRWNWKIRYIWSEGCTEVNLLIGSAGTICCSQSSSSTKIFCSYVFSFVFLRTISSSVRSLSFSSFLLIPSVFSADKKQKTKIKKKTKNVSTEPHCWCKEEQITNRWAYRSFTIFLTESKVKTNDLILETLLLHFVMPVTLPQ